MVVIPDPKGNGFAPPAVYFYPSHRNGVKGDHIDTEAVGRSSIGICHAASWTERRRPAECRHA
jgi:hypothetical protein